MTRGVKAGIRRGHYNRFSKPRLQKMANDIRNGRLDRDAVAHVFEITGSLPNSLIAQAIRAGAEFNPDRLASALERLGTPAKPSKHPKGVPIWMAKAAIKHRNGMRLSDALGLGDDYSERQRWRAYHRLLKSDYGSRSARSIEKEINRRWPQRRRGLFPSLEQEIRCALGGDGIPLALYRAWAQRDFWDQVEREILKKAVI